MLKKSIVLLLLVCSTGIIAQSHRVRGLPHLAGADIPFYPRIARAAKVSGWIKVRVTVEAGKVTKLDVLETKGKSGSQILEHGSRLLTDPTLANLRTWHFDSTVNDSFVVTYTYVLASVYPTENPKIEISPSLDVTVTTAPLSLD